MPAVKTAFASPWKCLNIRNASRGDFVLIQVQGPEGSIIARFRRNRENEDTLENKLIAYYEALETETEAAGRAFPVSEDLSQQVEEAVEHICADYRKYVEADALLDVYTKDHLVCGKITRETESFQQYLSLLRPFHSIVGEEKPTTRGQNEVISFGDLIFDFAFQSFRGTCFKCSVPKHHIENMVFKGFSFADFLAFPRQDFECRRDAMYREMKVLSKVIPPHEHIIGASEFQVAATASSPFITGVLYPLYSRGTVAQALKMNSSLGKRVPLVLKAKWAFQIVSAMAHTHFNAPSWHQDIKPSNFLLDENDDIVIIDWEQGVGGITTFIAAPEANGCLEVHSSASAGTEKLIYEEYQGPPRINNIIGTPKWDVFPQWKIDCPRAVELADVYGIGVSLFVILEEIPLNNAPGNEDYAGVRVSWTSRSADVPQSWKDVVELCIAKDPNERMGLSQLVEFWRHEYQDLLEKDGQL
ncbi:Serine/threonine-protein kinase Nek6 [Colletotrichum truncatum]|uniref:Serine/threonine-protein kinase Nek6 n=1 Tax=Colletotrichum truncatum TaxID=5467 RepID=A0ACC3YUJ9_COLTU|nr:Serine/threonine-protein kinase Nek6 [Colletotrichum truncatum]KAF6780896.1 Serine/threonine-protein kinase Nek6 [Colletotrichum truncatum]